MMRTLQYCIKPQGKEVSKYSKVCLQSENRCNIPCSFCTPHFCTPNYSSTNVTKGTGDSGVDHVTVLCPLCLESSLQKFLS